MANPPGMGLSFTREQVERLISAGLFDSPACVGVREAQLLTASVMRNIWPLVEALQGARHA